MRAPQVALLLLLPALAGCTGGEGGNPNLAVPRVVIDADGNGGMTVFIHSAFGERRYDAISLTLDNETAIERATAFSLEHSTPRTGFFFEVAATSGESQFSLSGRAELINDTEKPRVSLSFIDAKGEWTEPRSFSLPYARVLERPEEKAS